ncbi:hypothetical protein J7I93_15855 [Bacillus sp. ISL-47]|uniref:hypothetical protein n=1 Tax=Bacillus sp. ISL-47 TaxID=2819130 RepID=UPI001BEB2188|nr:hypothetical protein [Bacillus sp. ISL-47]MBT2689664.1 hypothetical protein [Bacillus sp. ISL-47]MBT2709310.1 hypothetical protein [Pseudomonas sp. ISL-84]
MKKKRHSLLTIFGIIFCFVLFAAGILFSDSLPFLTLLGIAGLSGVYYFVFRLVKGSENRQK